MHESFPDPVSRPTVEHYVWGDVSDGWKLLDTAGLSVIEERVPGNAGERWHVHAQADQFFFILEGEAEVQTSGAPRRLVSGQGLHVPAGLVHRFFNPGNADVRFLVISSPSTRGDRREVPSPQGG